MLMTFLMELEDESDREFAAHIFNQYNRLMCYEIRKIVGANQDVQDIMQDTLVSLVGKMSNLRNMEQRRMVNYIITATRNHAKNYLRKNSNVVFCSFDNEALNLANTISDGVDVEGTLVKKDEEARLSDAWPNVDAGVRELLERKYILCETDEEIAAVLGVKPSSVRMMITRARRSALKDLRRAGISS